MEKVGIQLYSVKEDVDKDFHGTLRRLADIGFSSVEFAGYREVEASVMKSWLEECHLEALSSHVALNLLQEHLEEEIAYLKELGCRHIVCPWSDIKNREDTLKLAEDLNAIGKKCAEQGMTLSYHNHHHEFQKDGGKPLIDILYENTDPAYVKAQPDVYWVARGGEDPVSFLKRYADRIELVHMKELKDAASGDNTAVGKGVLDFPAIIRETPGCQYIIEQETVDMDLWDALAFGCAYLKKL